MAEREFPESYKDPLYASLDAATEQRLELPPGLLSSVRSYGERSNHSQTNEEKTFGVYQFTPSTRKAILDKYGIDVTLSPQNASLGAGYLLQEGLKRNGNDPSQAVGEYIGGTDRANWGKTTKAYMTRVMTAWKSQQPTQQEGMSTFDRVQASMRPSVPPDAIARVFAAYEAGEMTPQERAEFEQDVNAGRVMLPKGAKLQAAETGNVLPMGVVNAYFGGQMTEQEKADLKADVAAGLVKLPPGIDLSSQASQIPGENGTVPPQPTPNPEPQTVGEKLKAAGKMTLQTLSNPVQAVKDATEMGASVITGLTTGAAGMLSGTAQGLVENAVNGQGGTPEAVANVERRAAQGADLLTYKPKSPVAQEALEPVGRVMQNVGIPLAGVSGEMALAGRAAASAAPAVEATTRAGAAAASEAAKAAGKGISQAGRAVRDQAVSMTSEATRKLIGLPEEPKATGQMGSVGAAGTDPAAMRRATAQQLPVPMELTTGQATRGHQQLRFEGETAKGDLGQPLRENAAKQNVQLAQNFEALIDDTGAHAPNVLETGRTVVESLRAAAAKFKAKYRALYQAADKAGETQAPVDLAPLAEYLNANRAGRSSASILGTIADELKTQGVGGGSLADGTVTAGPATLRQAEAIRKIVNKFVKDTDPNDVRVGTEIKGVIDQITEGAGGELYKEARAARQRYAQLFENHAVVNDLMRTTRGTADRAVALEDVFRRTILNGSREDLSMLRRTLQIAGGEEGHQAWRELQGQTLRHLLDEATKGVGSDISGNPIFSAAKLQNAIRGLDVDQRLEFVLGKQRAQMVRDINEIAKVVMTVPPGALNTSNTASVILAAIAEAGATGGLTGLPVPVLSTIRLGTKYVRDRAIRQRVLAALGKAEQKRVKAPRGVVPNASQMPPNRTVH